MKPITENVLGMTAMTDEEFQNKVNHYVYHNDLARPAHWDERRDALAAEFEVARMTVVRWANGKARPHPLLQSQIVLWIEEHS